MHAHYFGPKCSRLILAVTVSVFIAGCATQPSSKPASSSQLSEIEGKWSWSQQGPWNGYFVLEKGGDAYTGTLDDTSEGTYGDRIADVEVSDDHIKFTRDGGYGIQYWEGSLKIEDGQIKITDGQWQKEGVLSSGTFIAEKID